MKDSSVKEIIEYVFKKLIDNIKKQFAKTKENFRNTFNSESDKFAIEFIEWCVVYGRPQFPNKNEWTLNNDKFRRYTTKEMLAIFKGKRK